MGAILPANRQRGIEQEVHHWLLTTARRGGGGEEGRLEPSQPQKTAGDSTVPIVRFHYTPLLFAFF